MSDEDKLYLAGIIDTNGTLWYSNGDHRQAYHRMGCSFGVLEILQKYFKVGVSFGSGSRSSGTRPVARIKLSALCEVLPLMRLNKAEYLDALRYMES